MYYSQRSAADSGEELIVSFKKENERGKNRKNSRDHKEKENEKGKEKEKESATDEKKEEKREKERDKEDIDKIGKKDNRERKDSTDKNEKKEKKESKEGRDGKVESSDDDNLKDFGSEFEDLARGLDYHNLIMKEMQFMMMKIIEQVRTWISICFLFSIFSNYCFHYFF